MGKRELVLIVVFVVLGILVYEFTAPPPPPGSETTSVSSIIRNIRRDIHGARETASADTQQTMAVAGDVKMLRISVMATSDITVTGETRADLSAQTHVVARGYDAAEAKASADSIKLKLERVGDAVVVSVDRGPMTNPPVRRPPVEFVVTLKVPKGLTMRMDPHSGRIVVSQLAGAEIAGARGETRVSAIAGPLQLAHVGGPLQIDGAGSLKLNARNSRGSIKHVAGTFGLDAIGGDLALDDVTGPLEIEARNTDLKIGGISALKPTLRVNATSGRVRIDGLRTEARIDGRNTVIDVAMDTAAPVTIYNTGDSINVTTPSGGYTLDALATDGHMTITDGNLKPSGDPDPRAAGPVRGGGATLTLRVTRGTINVVASHTAGK